VSDSNLNERPAKEAFQGGAPLNKIEALTILYLQKQALDGCSPEELVGRYIEAHDRIVKEFNHQLEVRKRRLNPLPM
jgi:hypothetical protein